MSSELDEPSLAPHCVKLSRNGKYNPRYPTKRDKKVARLHLAKIGVKKEGPFKADHYRY